VPWPIISLVDEDLSQALAKIGEQLDTVLRRLDAIEQQVGFEQRKDETSSAVQQQYGIPSTGEG